MWPAVTDAVMENPVLFTVILTNETNSYQSATVVLKYIKRMGGGGGGRDFFSCPGPSSDHDPDELQLY